MKTVIFVSAGWNILLALFMFKAGFIAIEVSDQTLSFFNFMIGAFLLYTSAVLALSVRDLANRASLVFWEGNLRILAAVFILATGVGVLGSQAYLLAGTDLAWALVYQFGLMKTLKKSYWQLLTDA